MPHLPPELVFAVLEHGYYTTDGSPDYRLLANCSLVCTSWSVPALSLLFHKTTPLRFYTIQLFHAALTSSALRGKWMGHLVRSLDIAVGRSPNDICQPESLADLLQACPLLYELILSTYSLHEFDQFALAKLKDAGRSICAFNILRCGVQSPVLFQLLGIWPQIRFLKIGTEIAAWPWRHPGEPLVLRQQRSTDPNTNLGLPLPSARVALYDLSLSRIPRQAVLGWLLGSSTCTLRILELRELPGTDTRAILAAHAPHLRSLRVLHFNLDAAAYLRQCTNLEEFVVYSVPVVVPLVPQLPPSIEHLSFRNPLHTYRDTLLPILDAIVDPAVLPKLRVVTCDENSAGLRDFQTLKTRCAERDVEVVVSKVPFWMHEDPVVVHRFPRRRSVSNFGLMTS